MRLYTSILLILSTMALYGQDQQNTVNKAQADWRFHATPEVMYFICLYQDDFLGDSLQIGKKTYFFSQSPMKHFPDYMRGKIDPRIVLAFGLPRVHTHGHPDKGYVLHFSLDADSLAFIDRATYLGSIYPEDFDNKPLPLSELQIITKTGLIHDRLSANWLHGRYRMNDEQVQIPYDYNGNRLIAIFEHGKLVKMIPDEEKTQFNPPYVDLNERPSGVKPRLFVPTYVYYKIQGDIYLRSTVEEAAKVWREKLLNNYQTEPFLDPDCANYLINAWLYK